MTQALAICSLTKTFTSGRRALDGLSLTIEPGEMVALIGASGSGKSTLLRHVPALVAADKSSGGSIEVFGRVAQRGGAIARDIRDIRSGIGFVFQQFNLVGRLSVLQNVMAGVLHRVPLWRGLSGRFEHADLEAGMVALDRVGMAEYAMQRASTLSGGQQQRAAIARTLVQRARLVLADEPIASLDPESSRRVMETLTRINRIDGCTVLVSLHQVNFALRFCPRTIALRDGAIAFDGASSALTPAVLRDLYGKEAEEILKFPDEDGPSGRNDPVRLPVHQGVHA